MKRICITAEYTFSDGTKATWTRTEEFDEFERRFYKVMLSRENRTSFCEASYTVDLPTVSQSLHVLKNFFKDHPELK